MSERRYIFDDVSERDMDMLYLEEFACSEAFLSLFTNCIGIKSAEVISTESSKTDVQYGESDMTIILSVKGKKHGLLIEDKIDAIAMPNQAARYEERGKLGVAIGEYDSFDVFIIAPKKYLEENQEAKKYPHSVAYEDVAELFKNSCDKRYQFKYQQIMQAITKQKTGYQVIENTAVTDFWNRYIEYQKEYYPELMLVSTPKKRGSNATWPRYHTVYPGLFIYHKSEFGFIDLTFSGSGEKLVELEKILWEQLPDHSDLGLSLHRTGKSAALRLYVPVLDFKESFVEQEQKINECSRAIERMADLTKRMNLGELRSFIYGGKTDGE